MTGREAKDAITREIILAMQTRPEDIRLSDGWIRDDKSVVHVLLCAGGASVHRPSEVGLGIRNYFRLKKAIAEMIARRLIDARGGAAMTCGVKKEPTNDR